MKTTLRKLITIALQAIQTEFLTENEIGKFSDFILNNSTLAITNTNLQLQSGSTFGVGENNKDRELELPKYLTFFITNYDNQNQSNTKLLAGLPQRDWQLCSYDNLFDLEQELRTAELRCCEGLKEGNLVVLVDGKAEAWKVVEVQTVLGLIQPYIVWDAIKPYTISYTTATGASESEQYNSKKPLDERVITLLNQGAEGLQVRNRYDNEHLHFTVTKTEYNSQKPGGNGDKEITWSHPYWDDECDEGY